jgi:hypothetical protein
MVVGVTTESPISLHRLWWLGPLTVGAAVIAVLGVQWSALRLSVSPDNSPLVSHEPAIFTAILVAAAVLVFVVVVKESSTPFRIFRRIALATMLASLIPDVLLGLSSVKWASWPLATTFMVMHVIAWAVTVTMLSHLTT